MTNENIICSDCNGSGIIKKDLSIDIICTRCRGTGEVDWIDNIVYNKERETDNIIKYDSRTRKFSASPNILKSKESLEHLFHTKNRVEELNK